MLLFAKILNCEEEGSRDAKSDMKRNAETNAKTNVKIDAKINTKTDAKRDAKFAEAARTRVRVSTSILLYLVGFS